MSKATPCPAIPKLSVLASFTVDPIVEALQFWTTKLPHSYDIDFIPYGPVLPSLINPVSTWRSNKLYRTLIINLEDLYKDVYSQSVVKEFIECLLGAHDNVKTLVLLCPPVNLSLAEYSQACGLIQNALSNIQTITFIDAGELFAMYTVLNPVDAVSAKTAHVPYVAEAMVAIGTGIARWLDCHLRAPLKMIATDADQTLWGGVLGEDMPAGLKLEAGHISLQQALKKSTQRGIILAMASKNNANDMDALWLQRTDMVLAVKDFMSLEVSWGQKHESLFRLTQSYKVADKSVLFIDDNPVECAAVRAAMPHLMTVQIPPEPEMASFVKHLWALDQAALTNEDMGRTEKYLQEQKRVNAKFAAPNLREFFERLNLEILIEPASKEDLPRLSQMTHRTTQFNALPQPIEVSQLSSMLNDSSDILQKITVSDRFGDYGIVGLLHAKYDAQFMVDIFLLSCRALGRGVEHKMIRALAEQANLLGFTELYFKTQSTQRNVPIREFLTSIPIKKYDEGTLCIPTYAAQKIVFHADQANDNIPSKMRAPQADTEEEKNNIGDIYEWIALRMTNAHVIYEEMRGRKIPRPKLTTSHVSPSPGIEQGLARIWENVLRIEEIGSEDQFTELGGKSIHLVQIHSTIRRNLMPEIDLTDLFRFGTISSLAQHISKASNVVDVYTNEHRDNMARQGRISVAQRRKDARRKIK